ncbi:hypothetical protein OA88_14380 [Flavobacterium sp. JRM]|nr:hypothetical protein OA88_14380 [Flavobacterium sp. JRM]
MGSSINCIIPKEENYSIEEIKQKLNNVFSRLKIELLHLKKYSDFPENVDESWFLILIPGGLNEPEYIMGEGGSFDIFIYKNVVLIGCIERFGSLHFEEKNISEQLIKIMTELSEEFSSSNRLLIGCKGTREMDEVVDLAYYNHADFNQICNKMIELNGVPARNLNDLKEKPWYLK